MSIVKNIDNITEWIKSNICPKVTLKLPNEDKNDHRYEVKTVNPAVFAIYVPPKDKLPPNVQAPIPSICAQVIKGKDSPDKKTRVLDIQLNLAAWNPGTHESEKVEPVPDPDKVGGYRYIKYQGEIESQTYKRNYEGWRDIYTFLDRVLAEVEGTDYIAGYRVIKEEGIEYGPFMEDGIIYSDYPYWFTWVRFSLEVGLVIKIPPEHTKYL